MNKTIKFYNERETYGEFSNFAAFPITLKGKLWPTTEHYFQAQKFADTQHEEPVRQAPSPTIAKQMGGDKKRPLRSDWASVKDDVMREATRDELLAKARSLPANPVAFEAFRDGDTYGWFLVLVTIYDE